MYTRTAANDALPVVRRLERDAVAAAAAVICLSRSDSHYIISHLLGEEAGIGAEASNAGIGAEVPAHPADGDVRPCAAMAGAAGAPPVSVLLPALRSDMEQIPLPRDGVSADVPSISHPAGSDAAGPQPGTSDAPHARCQHSGTQRRYLTCCVRLSPEKEADRFVALVEALSRPSPQVTPHGTGSEESGEPRSRLEALKLVPLMCGAATTEYGKTLQARLLAAVPSAVIESRFLPPTELAKVRMLCPIRLLLLTWPSKNGQFDDLLIKVSNLLLSGLQTLQRLQQLAPVLVVLKLTSQTYHAKDHRQWKWAALVHGRQSRLHCHSCLCCRYLQPLSSTCTHVSMTRTA